MGSPGLDLRMFRALRLHSDLGLNLAFLTLPFHGRRNPGRGFPPVPGFDVLDTVHGLAQAAWDARQLVAYVRARTEQPVAIMGLSLGGCVAGLTASLDDVDAALLLEPVADLGSIVVETGERFGPTTDESLELASRASRLFHPVSLLAHAPRVAPEGRVVVAGTLDRFVPASTQSIPLLQHWDEPEVHWHHGGHVSLLWDRRVQTAIDAALVRVGLVATDRPPVSP
jgi:hypothetical protein